MVEQAIEIVRNVKQDLEAFWNRSRVFNHPFHPLLLGSVQATPGKKAALRGLQVKTNEAKWITIE
jgi:hypothetical protein